jgi:hypothetical protein
MSIMWTSAPASRADPIALCGLGAPDGMCADGEEFNEGGIALRKPRGVVEVAGRDRDPLAHAAVTVDAENPDRHAAVRLSSEARAALAAGNVGIDHDELALCPAFRVRGNVARQFVPDNARVFQIRMLAFENMIVGPANACGGEVHQDPSFGSGEGKVAFKNAELTRLHAYAAQHLTGRNRLTIHTSSQAWFLIIRNRC